MSEPNMTYHVNNSCVKKLPNIVNGKRILLSCKVTGKIFDDINNLSGILTKHLKFLNDDKIVIPKNTFQRKKIELSGYKWFEPYFDFIEEEIKPIRCCKLCDWSTTDISNNTGCFEVHVRNKHSMSILDYLNLHPEDTHLHKSITTTPLVVNENDFIICKACGEKLKSITNTHLKKHNLTLLDYKLKYLGTEVVSKNTKLLLQGNYNNNLKHHPSTFTTKPQKEILEYLTGLGLTIINNDKKLLNGVEIDLLSHDLKLGIEFNGLYYHSESMGKDRQFHLNKTKLMNNLGYGLIHIFEDEWFNNTDLVKLKLKHIFGRNDGALIHPRKCIIKRVEDPKLKRDFLTKNHIQGSCTSNIDLVAYFNEKPVAIMSFNNKRKMSSALDDGTYELIRFATDVNYKLPGMANKLLKYFINNFYPNKIISFGDRRWVLDGDNCMYTKLGFEKVKTYPPDYRYFNSSIAKYKRFHKFGFGKSSLKKKLPNLDFKKTELMLMTELGYSRIWDCGLFKYELTIKKEAK